MLGESQITQSLKVRDLGVIFDQFLTFMIMLRLYADAHIFIIETLEKLGICYRIMQFYYYSCTYYLSIILL